jgi:hypothetical protein
MDYWILDLVLVLIRSLLSVFLFEQEILMVAAKSFRKALRAAN